LLWQDRGIYYLERSIEARNRDLAALRTEATELEAPPYSTACVVYTVPCPSHTLHHDTTDRAPRTPQNKSSPEFSKKIDDAESSILKAKEENEALQAQVNKVTVSVRHSQALSEKYDGILSKVQRGMPEDNIVEEMQTAISELEAENANDKNFLADVKAAVQDVNHGLDALRGQAKFLEQYRVDAIFRVFTLKAKVKCLKNRLATAK